MGMVKASWQGGGHPAANGHIRISPRHPGAKGEVAHAPRHPDRFNCTQVTQPKAFLNLALSREVRWLLVKRSYFPQVPFAESWPSTPETVTWNGQEMAALATVAVHFSSFLFQVIGP